METGTITLLRKNFATITNEKGNKFTCHRSKLKGGKLGDAFQFMVDYSKSGRYPTAVEIEKIGGSHG